VVVANERTTYTLTGDNWLGQRIKLQPAGQMQPAEKKKFCSVRDNHDINFSYEGNRGVNGNSLPGL